MSDFTGAIMRAGGASAMEGVPLNADSTPPKGALNATEHRLSFVFRIYGERFFVCVTLTARETSH